jgi:hypothetical protein
MGHVARTSGATGTHREQEFTRTLGPKLKTALQDKGHTVVLIGADSAVPKSDVFIALHTDGNLNRSIRGGSVGYPSNDPNSPSGQLARAWKRWHEAGGYSGGFHPDNYTQGLRFYYGFGKSSSKWKFLAEHGTTTNTEDEAWLFSHMAECVAAHVNAIGEIVGHPGQITPPIPITPPSSETEEEMKLWLLRKEDETKVWVTDLLTKRHVQSESELDDLVYLNKMQNGKLLFTPDPGSESGQGSYAMVRVVGAANTWLAAIPIAN